jgi:hypothetical protein
MSRRYPHPNLFTTSGFRRVDSGRIVESRATKRANRRARSQKMLAAEAVMLGIGVGLVGWGLTEILPGVAHAVLAFVCL